MSPKFTLATSAIFSYSEFAKLRSHCQRSYILHRSNIEGVFSLSGLMLKRLT